MRVEESGCHLAWLQVSAGPPSVGEGTAIQKGHSSRWNSSMNCECPNYNRLPHQETRILLIRDYELVTGTQKSTKLITQVASVALALLPHISLHLVYNLECKKLQYPSSLSLSHTFLYFTFPEIRMHLIITILRQWWWVFWWEKGDGGWLWEVVDRNRQGVGGRSRVGGMVRGREIWGIRAKTSDQKLGRGWETKERIREAMEKGQEIKCHTWDFFLGLPTVRFLSLFAPKLTTFLCVYKNDLW